MGWYGEQVLPRAMNWTMSGELFARERAACVGRARGRVLELGFGSGLNLPHYKEAVEELLALEPSLVARRLAAGRIERCPFPVRFVGLTGEEIPLEDGSVDCVTSTWTLCTIPDLARALAEVRRVLRPGGALHFLEHGLSESAGVARWQGRLEPLQKRLGGGCHLTRAIDEQVVASGLVLEDLDRHTMRGPRVLTSLYLGTARRVST